MTRRICFIGDSHVAAIRQALDDPRAARHAGRMSIFGSRGGSLVAVRLRKGELVSDDKQVRENFSFTGGAESIELDRYDAFCLVGCQVRFDIMEPIFERYATVAMQIEGRRPISSNLLNRIYEEKLKGTVAYQLAQLIGTTGKPAYLITNPRYSEGVMNHESGAFHRTLIEAGIAGDYLARHERAVSAVFGPLVRIIPQPESTLAAPIFTRSEFCAGSVRLARNAREHDEADFAHMNAEYGVRMLDAAFDVIDGSRATAAPQPESRARLA